MKVKVCGVTRPEDAWLAASLGAWAVGFVFYRGSPRYISPARAGEIIAGLPHGIHKVGVFVNAGAGEIEAARQKSGINYVQLHGEESPEVAGRISSRVSVIKALRLRTKKDLRAISGYRNIAAILVDSFSETARGGTGKVADWSLAKEAGKMAPVILAGGLTPENARQAINEVAPVALDLSSGLEAKPGIKDPEKLRRLFSTMRAKT